MAVVAYARPVRLKVSSSPVGLPLVDIVGIQVLLLIFHGVAGIDLDLAIFEALMLWWAVNARSLQMHRATLAQRFYGVQIAGTGDLPLGATIAYAAVASLGGPVTWCIDSVMQQVTTRSISQRLVGHDVVAERLHRSSTSSSSLNSSPNDVEAACDFIRDTRDRQDSPVTFSFVGEIRRGVIGR